MERIDPTELGRFRSTGESMLPPPRPRSSRNIDPADPRPDSTVFVMPGAPEQLAEEVKIVSPEGEPGDPKSGPASQRAAIVLIFSLILLASSVAGMLLDWGTGAVIFAIGMISLLVNPVVPAALLRARDRTEVLRHERDGNWPNQSLRNEPGFTDDSRRP